MEIGEEFIHGDRKSKYKVLEILPKHKFEIDMYVCLHEASGTKECFQRQDIDSVTLMQKRKSTKYKQHNVYPWLDEDIAELKEQIKFIKETHGESKFKDIMPVGKHSQKATQIMYAKLKHRGELSE